MQSVHYWRRRLAVAAAILALLSAIAVPAAAQSLFGGKQVEVQLTLPDGKPMADAEVRVFAPGNSSRPTVTGRTDSTGKFVFAADRDGFWSAEARRAEEIARVSIRVTGADTSSEPVSPYWLLGLFSVLLVIAVWYRLLRARSRRPRT